jgi:heat shock protein HslJ
MSQTGELGVDLVGRTFVVSSVGGVGALAAPTAVLTFGTDGRLYGRGTVNRVNGSYELDGDALTIGPMMSTMMAGPPEAMAQEHRLLAALGERCVVRQVPDGIELVAADGSTTRLRETGPQDALA